MKRLVLILVCLSLVFCFAGCDKKNTSSGKESVDVEYFAKLGQIPECEYKLGTDASEILKDFEEKTKNPPSADESFYYEEIERGDYNGILSADQSYYCKKSDKKKEVTHIVDYGTAYGFSIGAVSIEIKNALADMGFETAERDISDSEKQFVIASDNCTCLEYEFEKNTVVFVFADNALCATILHK